MNKILDIFIWFIRFFIWFIERLQYRWYKFEEDEIINTINPVDIKIKTSTGFELLKHIHYSRPHIEYKIILKNGMWLGTADDHPISINDNECIKTKDLSAGDYIMTDVGLVEIEKIKIMPFSLSMIDLTIDSKEHTYYSNNILVHNCTHPYTLIEIKDIINKIRRVVPIYILYFHSMKRKSLLDWFIKLSFDLGYYFYQKAELQQPLLARRS